MGTQEGRHGLSPIVHPRRPESQPRLPVGAGRGAHYAERMPVHRLDTLPTRELFPGFTARLVHTPLVTQSFVDCTAGASFPEHQHPQEQTVIVLDGALDLVVDGETHRLTPGMVYVIPGNVPHAGTAVVDTRVLDVFSPVREDLKS